MKLIKIIPIITATIAITQRQPFLAAIILTTTTVFVAVNITIQLINPWILALLILTYARGMLIIIIYLSSLTTNFYLKPKIKWMILIITIIIIPNTKKETIQFNINETFNRIVPNMLGLVILIALFILSSLAFQPQKTIQITIYDKKNHKTKSIN